MPPPIVPAIITRTLSRPLARTRLIASQLPRTSSSPGRGRTMSSVPSTMRAVTVSKTGGPEVLEVQSAYPVPKLQEGEILVRNKFAGINYIDTYFRTGLYPLPHVPAVLGQEGSGTVAAVQGSNSVGIKEGDRVVWIKSGGYAEYTAVAAERAIKIPEGVSDEDAVGGFLMGMTALGLVQEAYPVQRGDWVLVHAAAGGVGLLMCQILRDMGARTIGTAGGPEKCALAKEHGAEFTIDYKATSGPSWVDQVKEITGGQGVAVAYDSVGKDTWEGSCDVVRRKGKVVYFGNSSGPVPPFPLAKSTAKNLSVMRSTLMQYIVTRDEFEHYANGVLDLIKAGKLKIRYHKTYPLEDVAQAHRDLEGRKTTGKLLLSF